ncbi:MAG: carboxypeptidase regulatory-like domain-containing protein, partial [Candidatus Electrothrix sp. ATG2]|nr:carboxypeptidase regulatory-like domain-containing protein [Candidatus Electrothrix sp. ATG2]
KYIKDGNHITTKTNTSAPIKPASGENQKQENQELSPVDNDTGENMYTDAPADDEKKLQNLSGWVLDEAGMPISGLHIRATARHSPSIPSEGARQQELTTNHEGYFEFSGLQDGEYILLTQATGLYTAARTVVRAGIDSAVLVVSEQWEQEVYVYGFVEDSYGEPLAGVQVVPVSHRVGEKIYTDSAGNYGFPLSVSSSASPDRLRYTLEGYREQQHELLIDDLKQGRDIQMNAVLEPISAMAPINGEVLDDHGLPVPSAQIQLYSASLKHRYQAVSDQDGRFLLPEVDIQGGYRLWVHPQSGYQDYIKKDLRIQASGMDISVTLEPLKSGTLTGRMVDTQGKPVPRFSLWLTGNRQTTQVTGDRSGFFVQDELPEGEVTFQTRSSPYLSVGGIKVSAGANNKTSLILDVGDCLVHGYVEDIHGDPIPGAQLSLLWSHKEQGMHSRSSRTTTSDGNGYFLFSQVGSSPHILNVSAPGFFSSRLEQEAKIKGAEVMVQLKETL